MLRTALALSAVTAAAAPSAEASHKRSHIVDVSHIVDEHSLRESVVPLMAAPRTWVAHLKSQLAAATATDQIHGHGITVEAAYLNHLWRPH
jgi:hypothetical protein